MATSGSTDTTSQAADHRPRSEASGLPVTRPRPVGPPGDTC